MGSATDEQLLQLGIAINDELQKTFSRYTELKKNRMPETFNSEFFPKTVEEVVTYVPDPEPEPEIQQQPAPEPVPQIDYQTYAADEPAPEPEVQQANEEPPQPEVEPEPEQEPEPPKEEPKQAPKAPPPISPDIFNIIDNNENKEAKEDFFNEPIKPTSNQERESPKKETPLTKLNEIMAKMQQEEMEQRQRKEAEDKKQKDMVYGAFPPNMMNPGWMPYATAMPGFRPMGFGPSPYASNMPGMSPMFPPRMPFPMVSVNPLIPTVKSINHTNSHLDHLKHQ